MTSVRWLGATRGGSCRGCAWLCVVGHRSTRGRGCSYPSKTHDRAIRNRRMRGRRRHHRLRHERVEVVYPAATGDAGVCISERQDPRCPRRTRQVAHLLGRSVSFWREETNRLYVQAKLAEEGHLAPLDGLSTAVDGLLERMAFVGLTSYEPAFITRLDVAVDGRCLPEDGKLLLDALEGCRPPNGWRVRSVGVPRSTVYFSARSTESVKARSYCRNLKTRRGDPFGLIRLRPSKGMSPAGHCWKRH